MPNATTFGMVVNPNNPAIETQIKAVQSAARPLNLKIAVANARHENEFEMAFAALRQQGIAALLIGGDALFNSQRDRLATLAGHHAMR